MSFKLIKAGAAALALFAIPFAAQAADMPIKGYYKGAPRSVVSYYNWSGFYAGVNAGYGFGMSEWSLLPGREIKPKGAMFGGTVGYNWQAGAIVYGVEGDFDWSGVKGSVTCGPGGAVNCETSNTWLATFRGRLGYAFDRWMPYITGGGAYGNVKATISAPIVGAVTSASSNQLGWTVGVGLEYAFLGNWSAKIEYLYVDLANSNFVVTGASNGYRFGLIRAGVNYRF